VTAPQAVTVEGGGTMTAWAYGGTLGLAMALIGSVACGGAQRASRDAPQVIIEDSSLMLIEGGEPLPIAVNFGVDSAELDPSSLAALDAVADFIRHHEHLTLIEVQGHADERGSEDYNLDLSKRRAASVVRYLRSRGVAPARLRSRGLGSERPKHEGAGERAWQQNRRVEFVIVSDPSSG
jgi:outer membrane protein OmpA-like peptidoglycan-associated protein